MKTYELTLVLKEDAAKDEAQLKSWFAGKVKSSKSWGVRDLAYVIKGQRRGHYYYCELELESQAVEEMDKKLKQNETVLRYLLISKN